MTPEIRRYLRHEVDRLQKLRHECDKRLLQAWGLGCTSCGGHVDDIAPGCTRCSERHRARARARYRPVMKLKEAT